MIDKPFSCNGKGFSRCDDRRTCQAVAADEEPEDGQGCDLGCGDENKTAQEARSRCGKGAPQAGKNDQFNNQGDDASEQKHIDGNVIGMFPIAFFTSPFDDDLAVLDGLYVIEDFFSR